MSYKLYTEYLAIKQHFLIESYDYFKYNGKVKASLKAYEDRRDRYNFEKLGRKRNPQDILVANLHTNPNKWIQEIVSEEGIEIGVKFTKRKQSLSYSFTQDLEKLKDDFTENFRVSEDYPFLYNLYVSGEVDITTMVILNGLTNFLSYWKNKIDDTIVYPITHNRIAKMHGFVPFEKDKYISLTQKRFV